MTRLRTAAEWMAERGVGLADVIAASGLDDRIVTAIMQGRYTPSPEQRLRVAGGLGVDPAQVAWGHTAEVQHVYGHGPQFGRSP